MSISMKRRDAIAAGLRPWFGEEEIATALLALEEDAAFNLQRFADRVYDRLAPACPRREFHRALVRSVFLAGEEGTSVPAAEDPAQTRVFARLLGSYLKLLAAQRGPAEATVRSYLLEKVDRFGLSGSARKGVTEWLSGLAHEPSVPLGREAMRQMVNLSYVLACEYLGPVAADRLLSLAVKEAEGIPEARIVPPRTLL